MRFSGFIASLSRRMAVQWQTGGLAPALTAPAPLATFTRPVSGRQSLQSANAPAARALESGRHSAIGGPPRWQPPSPSWLSVPLQCAAGLAGWLTERTAALGVCADPSAANPIGPRLHSTITPHSADSNGRACCWTSANQHSCDHSLSRSALCGAAYCRWRRDPRRSAFAERVLRRRGLPISLTTDFTVQSTTV